METSYETPLKGKIAICRAFHNNMELQRDASLYKIIWVQRGELVLVVDHIEMTLGSNEIVSLTPLQHLEIKHVDGEYITLLFNSNFYCIYGHDNEVSCNGLLFHGGSEVLRLTLSPQRVTELSQIVSNLELEFASVDNLQEEMLRILLKRFIITCTRIAKENLNITHEKEPTLEIVRQFYILVDNNFREKRQVQEYADMLNRSPKTLTNIFNTCKLPSPLRIIHERIEAEAKRLLLYSGESAKEISYILGFNDPSEFSRFFKKMSKQSVSDFIKNNKI